MENLQHQVNRVQAYLTPRLRRLRQHFDELAHDPRNRRGTRHEFTNCLLALTTGLLVSCKALRDTESQSQELGLGRRGEGMCDGALTHVLKLMGEHDLDAVLVRGVREMAARGQLAPVDMLQGWTAIDGKYETLDHHCGGIAQKIEDKHGMHWRLGALRAVLITAAGKPALGQWPMAPVAGDSEKDAEKRKHTGETTNLPLFIGWLREQYNDLTTNFTLDAGLWSKAIFLAMDVSGFGVFCGLKGNKPELFDEAKRVLRSVRAKQDPSAVSDWESCQKGKIRRELWRTTKLDGWNGWTHLRQVVVVKQPTRHRDGKKKVELRYFVTNATTGMLTPRQLLRLVRLHWGIENDCNWSFDLQFGEDDGRWCTQNKATLVLGVLRMIAYNLLQWLRKVHVQVQAVNGATAPRPWRGMFDLVSRYLPSQGSGLLRSLARPPPRPRPLLLTAMVAGVT